MAGRGLNTDGGVRFSTAFPMDDVEWVMLRASRLPAPNEYKPVPVQGKSPYPPCEGVILFLQRLVEMPEKMVFSWCSIRCTRSRVARSTIFW